MITSWLVKQRVRSVIAILNEDDYDVDAFLKAWTDDAIYDGTSELGPAMTLRGKKAIGEWFHRWKREFPKRHFDVKDICFTAFPLSPTNVVMVQWTLTQTDRQGRVYRYDGVTVTHVKNLKTVRATEHISFAGLPQLSTLVRPTGGGKMVPVTPDKSSPHPPSGDERQKPGNVERQSPPKKKRKTRRS